MCRSHFCREKWPARSVSRMPLNLPVVGAPQVPVWIVLGLKVIELLRSSSTDHCCPVAAPGAVPSDSALQLAFCREELNSALVCSSDVPVVKKEVAPGVSWSSVAASAAGPVAGGLAWSLLRLLVRTCRRLCCRDAEGGYVQEARRQRRGRAGVVV